MEEEFKYKYQPRRPRAGAMKKGGTLRCRRVLGGNERTSAQQAAAPPPCCATQARPAARVRKSGIARARPSVAAPRPGSHTPPSTGLRPPAAVAKDRKSTRLNSS